MHDDEGYEEEYDGDHDRNDGLNALVSDPSLDSFSGLTLSLEPAVGDGLQQRH